MKYDEEIKNLCCSNCILGKEKGFLFKKSKKKTFSCSCLGDDTKLICEECEKSCHNFEGHETIEVGEKCISEFICSCKSDIVKENTMKSSAIENVQSKCSLYKLFEEEKSFFSIILDKDDELEQNKGEELGLKQYICLFCEKRCQKKLIKLKIEKDEEKEKEKENICLTCCYPDDHKSDIENNFKKIFELINKYESVRQKGKRINLMQIFQKLYNHSEFKVYFEIYEEITKNGYILLKSEKKKDEDITIICKYVGKFIKYYYKHVLRSFVYPNDEKVSFLNFDIISNMLNKTDFRMEIRIKCLKIFKYMIFNSIKKRKFIRIEKDKNISPLHRLVFGLTLDELFENNSIISKENFFKLMDIIINNLNFNNDGLSEKNFLLLFIQYLDLFAYICHSRDLERETIEQGNKNISIILDYIMKNDVKFSSDSCKKRRDKIIMRLEKFTSLHFLKNNDRTVYDFLTKYRNHLLSEDSFKTLITSEDSNIQKLDLFAFNNNISNTSIITNLFSIIDSSGSHISKLDTLDMTMASNDFYQENLQILYNSNLKLDDKLLMLNTKEYINKYEYLYQEFNKIYSKINKERILLIEGKEKSLFKFHKQMEDIVSEINSLINETINDKKNTDSIEFKQFMLYKIGFLDSLVDLIYFISINKFLKKSISKEKSQEFYKKVLNTIDMIVKDNSFLIRLLFCRYYVECLSFHKKNILLVEYIIFYEKKLKKLREDNLLTDVTFFCQHVGDIYKKECNFYNKNEKSKSKQTKRDFLIKTCLIMGCFKVCMEVLTENNLYTVSRKLYYILVFILKKDEKEQDIIEEFVDYHKSIEKTFFNKILTKLGGVNKISFKEKESFDQMEEDIELELYYLKNIVDLIISLNMEYFNLICTNIDMKPIIKLCHQSEAPPLIRKAMVSMYVKYTIGNYFNISVLFPQNLNELFDFDLVIKENEERMLKMKEEDYDKKSDLIMNENYGLMLKENKIDKHIIENEKYAIKQNLKRYEMEKGCYLFIIENLKEFPLIFAGRSFFNVNIQKNIYNYFKNAIYDPVNLALFRLIMYPNITKEMKLTIFKMIIFYIKSFHHLLLIIRENFKDVNLKLFKTYISLDKNEKNIKKNDEDDNIKENPKLTVNNKTSDDNIKEKLNLTINVIERIIKEEIEQKYIYNLDLYKMLSIFKSISDMMQKTYKENSKDSESEFKISLKNIVYYYNHKKSIEKSNVIFSIFNDQNTNEDTKKNLFISLFREINLRSGIGTIKKDIEKESNKKMKTSLSFSKSAKSMKETKTMNNKSNFHRKTMTSTIKFFKEDKESFIKPNKNIIIFNCINRLIKQDPTFCQTIIRDTVISGKFFDVLIKEKLVYLFQMCINNFKVMENSTKNINIIFLNEMIEFFRLLCENHNKYFQSFIINFKYTFPDNDEHTPLISIIFNHLTKILKSIEYFSQKESLLEFSVVSKKNYFNDILINLNGLINECMQGTYKYNFSDHLINTKNEYFIRFLYKMRKILDIYEITGEDDFELSLKHFFQFGVSFLEENSNKPINKKRFLKLFSMNQLMFIIVYLMKKFYLINIKKPDNINLKSTKELFKEVNEVEFDDDGLEKIKIYYLTTQYEKIHIALYVAIKIFYFIQLSTNYDIKFNEIINEFEKDSNVKDEKRKKILKQIYQFFKLIIHDVEVENSSEQVTEIEEFDYYSKFFKFNKNEQTFINIKKYHNYYYHHNFPHKSEPIKRVFIIVNMSIFLEKRDVVREIINLAPCKKGKKLVFLLNRIPYLKDHLEAKKYFYLNHPILNKIISYEAENVIKISCCCVIFINVLNALTLYMEPDYTISGNLENMIFNLSLLHLIFISIYFMSLVYFTFIKHRQSSSKKSISSIYKFYKSFLKNLASFFFIKFYWIFINGFLALFGGNFRVFYSFQLISVFYLSDTMTSALDTIKQKFSQFAATILIIVLISMLFASLGYNYYNNLYYNSDLEYNMCDSYFHCFLTILGWGFINGSVDFTNIKSIKDPTYWDHFAFSWMYYFLISIIMVNIINAIIVDSFQDLRVEANEKRESRCNDCYICSLNRTTFEISGIKFNDHISKEHSVCDYTHYLIRISEVDYNSLNSIDSYAKYCYENRKTNFFPNETSISLRNKK